MQYDVCMMSYALYGGMHGHGMDALSERYLGHTPISIKSLLGTGKSAKTFDLVPIDEASKYAAEDADITLRLWQLFKPQLHAAKVTRVYETLERPMVGVLGEMDPLAALAVVVVTELTVRWRSRPWSAIADQLLSMIRIGFLYGLFLEAFKLI